MDMDNFTNESTCAVENATGEPFSATNQFKLPHWQVALWTLPYTAIVLAAIVGNSIVIWIVFAHANMRTVTNYFLVNLAFADVSIASFNTIFTFTFSVTGVWYYGKFYCFFMNFVPTTAVSASIYTLTAICLERYIAIVHPLKPRMSRMCAKSVIAAIWLCAATVNVPLCIYSHFYTFKYREEEWSVCSFQWPDDNVKFWYDVGLMIINYFMPLLVMAVAYTIVGFTLWAGKIPGEATQRHVEQMKAKRKVVKMMVIVVVTFCVCWLPYHVYFLLDSSYKEWKHIQQVYLAVFWLAMSNSMYNPFIYCWLNQRFRYGFQTALRWCPGVPFPKDPDSSLKMNRFTKSTSTQVSTVRLNTVHKSTTASSRGARRVSETSVV
ncbi:TACR3 [Branchiostoma lanceolatum]|uniref:TACR3 protein n=1 Tax=Branchiostoma lanceolatum TaxID=7740 RepID=A0A8J9Z2I1_BRALA|nr:TACR3 [Branchiostoma lanceolatum]